MGRDEFDGIGRGDDGLQGGRVRSGRATPGAGIQGVPFAPPGAWLELDPEEVWRNLADAIREANARLGHDPVEALAGSAQGEAAVPVTADGRVLAASPITFDIRTRP